MSPRTAIEWTDTTWNPGHRLHQGVGRLRSLLRRNDRAPIRRHESVSGRIRRHAAPRTDPRSAVVADIAAGVRQFDVGPVHAEVPDEFIIDVFAAMAVARQHTFQILTKRPGRMRSLLRNPRFAATLRRPVGLFTSAWEWPLPNVWLGVSAENQRWADIRIPVLLDTPAAVRFVSAEPLLGPLDLSEYLFCGDDGVAHTCTGCTLDWVIAGGESGPGARPMHPDWVRSIRDLCGRATVPFFFKQWGAWAPAAEPANPRTVRRRVVHLRTDGTWERVGHLEPPGTRLERVGKTAAGHVLDGVTWHEFPETPAQKGNAA